MSSSTTEFKFKIPFTEQKETFLFGLGCSNDPSKRTDNCWKKVDCVERTQQYCTSKPGNCYWQSTKTGGNCLPK